MQNCFKRIPAVKPETYTLPRPLFAACMPIAIVGYFSAIAQGKTAAAGVSIIAKKPDQNGKAITMAAMVETYAVIALLVSILSIFSISGLNI